MSQYFGMPGINGSLGKCCYCGGNFMKEILCRETVQQVSIGEVEMFVHHPKGKRTEKEGSCFRKLLKLVENGKIAIEELDKLPVESPLREIFRESIEEIKKGRVIL